MKILKEKMKAIKPISEKSLTTASKVFEGGLPKDCGIYVLPLFCDVPTEITDKKDRTKKSTFDVLSSPFIYVKNNKIIKVDIRAVSGFKQGLAIELNEANKVTKYTPKYANFDSTKSIFDCVNKCFKTPLAYANDIDKVYSPDFGITGKETPIYTPTDYKAVAYYNFTADESYVLTPEILEEQYKESLSEFIEGGKCTEDLAKSWLQ